MSTNWHEFEKPNSNLIMNKIAVNLFVLGTFMECRIGSNVNDSLIVAR